MQDRNRPGNLADVPLDPLVLHSPRQRHAPAFAAHFHVGRARQQLERIVDEVLDLLIVCGALRLAASHRDGREQQRRGHAGRWIGTDLTEEPRRVVHEWKRSRE